MSVIPAPAATMRRRQRRSGPSVWAAVIALTSLLVACGGDDDSESSAPPSQPQTTSTTETTETSEPTGTSQPDEPDGSTEPGPVTGETVASMASPIWIMPRPGDDHLWVSERQGRVRRVAVDDDGSLSPQDDPVLDITDEIEIEFEHGLFSHAFDAEGDRLFVSYTDSDGNSVVARYDITGDTVDEASREQLFFLEQPHGNHNGGHIVFHDGSIWLGMGDGGDHGDPDDLAQNPDVLFGKMIRIDPDSGDHEWVILGLRNPWRFAFDTDGTLWIADVGQGEIEEVNRLAPHEIDGANMGWSGYEGSREFWNGEGRRAPDAVFPVFEYERVDPNCSITGGFAYRGSAIEGLQGAFLFTDWCAGDIRAVHIDDDGNLIAEHDLAINVANPWSFGYDADGEPFVLSGDGDIVRIVPAE